MEHLPAVGVCMVILQVFVAAVWFVIRLMTNPLVQRIDKLEHAAQHLTASPLGQKVHDISNQLTLHYEHDDRRFDAVTDSIAVGRKENMDNFAELRKALPARKSRGDP